MPLVATDSGGKGICRRSLDPREVVGELSTKLYGDRRVLEHISL